MNELIQMSFGFDLLQVASDQEVVPEAIGSLPIPDIPDAGEREHALEITKSWVVEAPAGSGKTGLLIQRFLKLLAFGEVDEPEHVLAITFTRKAGHEMRQRVLEQLFAAHTGTGLAPDAGAFAIQTRSLAEAVLARDLVCNWNLLADPTRLNIRTIDSFCAELCSRMPVTSGASFRFKPSEDPEFLYALAAERLLMKLGREQNLSSDLERLLLLRDAQTQDLLSLLAEMLRLREQWGELIPLSVDDLTDEALDQQVRPKLDHTLASLISSELKRASDRIGPVLLQQVQDFLFEADSTLTRSDICERNGQVQSEDLHIWRRLGELLLTSDGRWRKTSPNRSSGFETSKILRERFKLLITALEERESSVSDLRSTIRSLQHLPNLEYPEEQWVVAKALLRTLQRALVELKLVFAERQTCDFSEVSLNARVALQTELNIKTEQLKHLLVDEMQDTSAQQYALLEELTSGWDGTKQTVFFVGDPKQSIYEFRQARVERFRSMMIHRQFGHIPVSPLYLTANFRSQAALVHQFNTLFENVFPTRREEMADSTDVPFVCAMPVRQADMPHPLQWHLERTENSNETHDSKRPISDEDLRDQATATDQALEIRELIETYLRDWPQKAKGQRPKVAVLARSRSHLARIIEEFHRDRGSGSLPFRAVDVEALHERPEVLDLFSLTRALLEPADRVAWLSVLRSPVCGLTLPDLLALVGDGVQASRSVPVMRLIPERLQYLSDDGQHRVRRVSSVLEQAIEGIGRTSLSTHVERTWLTLGGDAFLRPNARENARRYLDLLHALETGQEPFTLELLKKQMQKLYAKSEDPDAAVDIMTIHRSKGLEWDLVIVPALERSSGRDSDGFLKWLEFDIGPGEPGLLLAPIHGKGEKASSLFSWLRKQQTKRHDAEVNRLLYVVCTRAREELHLFGRVKGISAPRRQTLLGAAWKALQAAAGTPSNTEPAAANGLQPLEPLLALAASQSSSSTLKEQNTPSQPRRLPLSFDPTTRFVRPAGSTLNRITVPASLPEIAMTRGRPSFEDRALDHAVQSYLRRISNQMQMGRTPYDLLQELQDSRRRLETMLRNSGLGPDVSGAKAVEGQEALEAILRDPVALWLLSPKDSSNDLYPPDRSIQRGASLRADRTFLAPVTPGETGDPTHLWIVMFVGIDVFATDSEILSPQQQSRHAQLQSNAQRAVDAGVESTRIILALYSWRRASLRQWAYRDE